MWSPVRKLAGAGTAGYLGEWHAFRQYFTGVGPRAARDLYVWFEPDLLPGYAWSFPLPDGRANVGFGIARDGGKVERVQDMAKIWPELLARPHIRAVLGESAAPEGPHRAWPIPARIDDIARLDRPRAVRRRRPGRHRPHDRRGHRPSARDRHGSPPMRSSPPVPTTRPARRGATGATSTGRSSPTTGCRRCCNARCATARGPGPRSASPARPAGHGANFARWLFEDYPRAVLVTPRRWRSHRLSGDGAYRLPVRP